MLWFLWWGEVLCSPYFGAFSLDLGRLCFFDEPIFSPTTFALCFCFLATLDVCGDDRQATQKVIALSNPLAQQPAHSLLLATILCINAGIAWTAYSREVTLSPPLSQLASFSQAKGTGFEKQVLNPATFFGTPKHLVSWHLLSAVCCFSLCI